MMKQTRRDMLICLAATGASVWLPSAAFGRSAQTSARALALPPYPMRLDRRVERELKGGKAVVVEREWRIEFMRQGRGASISGTQLSAKVSAPAKLASISAIEEQRSTDAMWPILLSDKGEILAAGEFTDPSDMSAAIKQAEAMIAGNAPTPAAIERHRTYLAQMQKAANSLFELMPPDLFFPTAAKKTVSEYMELPDKSVGEFEISTDVKTSSAGPWMERFKRQITTRIGEVSRRSIEEWTLSKL